MKIKCIKEKLDDDQLSILGEYAHAKNSFSISADKEYIVFGLTFEFGDLGHGCFVQILSDNNHLMHVPMVQFVTTDDRVSKYWEIKSYSDGGVTLWPPSMYREFYHDDLTEDVIDVIEDFKRVKQQILSEF